MEPVHAKKVPAQFADVVSLAEEGPMRNVAPKVMALVSLGLFGLVGGVSDCVDKSPCDHACDYNDLGCGPVCDCSICASAPDDCDAYFDCLANRAHTCPEITHCSVYSNTACQNFIDAQCK